MSSAPIFAFGQNVPIGQDTLSPDLNQIQTAIEDFVENSDEEEFDFNTIFENLESLRQRPMNLNRVEELDFLNWGFWQTRKSTIF